MSGRSMEGVGGVVIVNVFVPGAKAKVRIELPCCVCSSSHLCYLGSMLG